MSDQNQMGENDPAEPFVLSDDDFLPAPRKLPSALSKRPPLRFLTVPLSMAILFFCASAAYWYKPQVFPLWVSKADIFSYGKHWKLISALFTHSDMLHLLSNLPLFLIFGWHLRAFFGLRLFPMVALTAGALTNLLTVLFYGDHVRLLGASGMLYAMVAMWLVFYVRFETNYKFWTKIMRAAAFSLVLLFPTTFQQNVSYLAHAWGFVTGLFLALIFLPITSIRTEMLPSELTTAPIDEFEGRQ